MKYSGLNRKVKEYQSVLQNTIDYRNAWKHELRARIVDDLNKMSAATGIKGTISFQENVGNAEVIVFSMGKSASCIFARVDSDTNKPLIKDFGSLVYQQLFNGKIQVSIYYPFIEGFGQPQPPKMIAIYRPEEIKSAYVERHLEEFIRALTEWEDYDDDKQAAAIGFQMNNINLPSK